MLDSLDLRTHNLKIIIWSDIMRMDGSMEPFKDWTGNDIAHEFNRRCALGTEIRYVEDSMWEFVNPEQARFVMEMISVS